ncbi:GNAT family N-acetyltransferase [Palleronia sp. LCG004]|uniref:GNAT family N-acetyltransferase n=1 Tax=Palleronia sp. LCG004 TaxID=3079304 RepID=UPI00294253C3|nr:GNAT family N-acetyltransferase [Palleronia sp. LCG004]WOI56027.1 GNAT family N-acetyltransferase [Palleronia sp. LCG004]
MAAPGSYRFRAARLDDLPMLRLWLATPEVSRWWDQSDPFNADELTDPRLAQWIVHYADQPFAYIQDYATSAWPAAHWQDLPDGTRGIDQFIGVPEMLGQGHGPAFVARRMQALFDAGSPAIVTDPHPENARAIAAYRRLGFRAMGPPRDVKGGAIVPMIATAPP